MHVGHRNIPYRTTKRKYQGGTNPRFGVRCASTSFQDGDSGSKWPVQETPELQTTSPKQGLICATKLTNQLRSQFQVLPKRGKLRPEWTCLINSCPNKNGKIPQTKKIRRERQGEGRQKAINPDQKVNRGRALVKQKSTKFNTEKGKKGDGKGAYEERVKRRQRT